MGNEEEYLTISETARKLRISPTTLWRIRKSGQIRWIDMAGSVRFHKDDIEAFRKQQTVKAKAA